MRYFEPVDFASHCVVHALTVNCERCGGAKEDPAFRSCRACFARGAVASPYVSKGKKSRPVIVKDR